MPRSLGIDLSEVEAYPGVVWVLHRQGHAGRQRHQLQRHATTSRCWPKAKVEFHGQPIFAVIAETRDIARRAARKAKIDYRDLPHWSDIDDALANGARSSPRR